jgi:23S rRNA (uridine2552-2'-O)-methyltransferase
LCEAAAEFAFDVLEVGGTFVAKVLAGGAENELQTHPEARLSPRSPM